MKQECQQNAPVEHKKQIRKNKISRSLKSP